MSRKSQPLCHACSKPSSLKVCHDCNNLFCANDYDLCNNCNLYFCKDCCNSIKCSCGNFTCYPCIDKFACSNDECPNDFCSTCVKVLTSCDDCKYTFCADCIYTTKFLYSQENYCARCCGHGGRQQKCRICQTYNVTFFENMLTCLYCNENLIDESAYDEDALNFLEYGF